MMIPFPGSQLGQENGLYMLAILNRLSYSIFGNSS